MTRVFFIILTLFFLAGCGDDSSASSVRSKQCVEPQNPYSDGTGHYAGYNWVIENDDSCDGNSDSFNEGCEEYFNQLNTYQECLTENNN